MQGLRHRRCCNATRNARIERSVFCLWARAPGGAVAVAQHRLHLDHWHIQPLLGSGIPVNVVVYRAKALRFVLLGKRQRIAIFSKVYAKPTMVIVCGVRVAVFPLVGIYTTDGLTRWAAIICVARFRRSIWVDAIYGASCATISLPVMHALLPSHAPFVAAQGKDASIVGGQVIEVGRHFVDLIKRAAFLGQTHTGGLISVRCGDDVAVEGGAAVPGTILKLPHRPINQLAKPLLAYWQATAAQTQLDVAQQTLKSRRAIRLGKVRDVIGIDG